jgi:hypothetical protein
MLETPLVSAIVVADSDGARIVAKYYDAGSFRDQVSQTEFEKKLHKKARGGPGGAARGTGEADIFLCDGMTVVYKAFGDVTFYVVGDGEENELMLSAIVEAIFDAVASLLKGIVDKRALLQHLELLLLTIDEIVDGGVPFELDPASVEARVMLRGAVPDSISSYQEMTIGQLADKGRAALAKQFVKGDYR